MRNGGALPQLVSVEILGDFGAYPGDVDGDVSAPKRGRGGHSGGDCLARAEGGRVRDVTIDDETDEFVHGVDVGVAVATRVPAQGNLHLRRRRSFRLGRACR